MNARFTLPALRQIVPYLDRLGVSHVYTSPLLAAAKGSMHGYDVTDPTRLNPELGSMDDLRGLASDLRGRGMGLLLDIVPNHMSTSSENARWSDVLANGQGSKYAKWFDIDWEAPGADGRLVLPVLGDTLEQVIARGELRLIPGEGVNRAVIAYFDARFPLRADRMPSGTHIGGSELGALVEAQHYRLASWREAAPNYRRFFDVNTLVALRMEDASVFDEAHRTVLDWIEESLIDGLRVDHVDGLRDPLGYLRRLRAAVDARAERRGVPRGEFLIVVEKILGEDEELRAEWPVQGTTGYDFLNDLEDLFVDGDGFAEIERAYRAATRLEQLDFSSTARAGRRHVLRNGLAPDLARVVRAAPSPASEATTSCAVAELIVGMPVYRTYIDAEHAGHIDPRDAAVLVASADDANSDAARALADSLLSLHGGTDSGTTTVDGAATEFIDRFQQLSGPAAARGIEDTALYVYVPLISRNEVGGAPDRDLRHAVERFHRHNAARAARWPRGLICTDTHDTKHGADVRGRLEAVSALPRDWNSAVERWRRINAHARASVRGDAVPDPNTEYLFYQALVGLWPAQVTARAAESVDPDELHALRPRLRAYLRKAAREAKRFTSWTDPNAEYESALDAFADASLDPDRGGMLLEDVRRFVASIADTTFWIGMSRSLLHLTSPGTPDIYQGAELSSASLVDPDNRRRVDYAAASRALARGDEAGVGGLRLKIGDGGARVPLTARILAARRASPELFARGSYVPLETHGPRASHVIAFARVHGSETALVVAPRLLPHRSPTAPEGTWWGDTRVRLPDALRAVSAQRTWHDVLSHQSASLALTTLGEVAIARLFSKIPLALLTASTST